MCRGSNACLWDHVLNLIVPYCWCRETLIPGFPCMRKKPASLARSPTYPLRQSAPQTLQASAPILPTPGFHTPSGWGDHCKLRSLSSGSFLHPQALSIKAAVIPRVLGFPTPLSPVDCSCYNPQGSGVWETPGLWWSQLLQCLGLRGLTLSMVQPCQLAGLPASG